MFPGTDIETVTVYETPPVHALMYWLQEHLSLGDALGWEFSIYLAPLYKQLECQEYPDYVYWQRLAPYSGFGSLIAD